MNIQVTIECAPVIVRFECPYCNGDVDIKYNDFLNDMPNDYPGDWGEKTINCPLCKKELKIGAVEWE